MGDLKIFYLYLNIDSMYHILPVTNQDTEIVCIYPPSYTNKSESDIIKIYQLLLEDKNGEAVEKMKSLERKLKINK